MERSNFIPVISESLIKFITETYAVSWFEIKGDMIFHNQHHKSTTWTKKKFTIYRNTKGCVKNLQHNAFTLPDEGRLGKRLKMFP